ncbi:Purine nucleoside permease [Candida viswanathii]|uniref:Purine nucleoside permease n=1 Tax=Candida viswanathii TaxID=5486 RepID=A0A367YKV0_9ASCO|nr:Purine nucleoside permease [Candida viswanathii]
MKFSTVLALAAAAFSTTLASPIQKRAINETALAEDIDETSNNNIQTSYGKPFAVYQPRAFIISMFELERDPWLEAMDFKHNITVPGLSPLYPTIHCTTNYTICQITTGEGEINAAASITALGLNPLFDLTKTYFLVAGIAGGEPQYTTLGGVTFAKLDLGYIPYGTDDQDTYPGNVYGTEVFELNEALRDRAYNLASNATLNNGNKKNAEFRKLYNETAARGNAKAVKCDSLTSDNYFTGNVLNNYFSNLTKLLSNGSATYCATAQEDNATLEVLTRLNKYGLVDYDRIVVMRTISNFSRPPPSLSAFEYFFNTDKGGISASLENLVLGGTPILHDIIQNWDTVYEKGIKYASKNYVGDIFATLGGTPDFGKASFDVA